MLSVESPSSVVDALRFVVDDVNVVDEAFVVAVEVGVGKFRCNSRNTYLHFFISLNKLSSESLCSTETYIILVKTLSVSHYFRENKQLSCVLIKVIFMH